MSTCNSRIGKGKRRGGSGKCLGQGGLLLTVNLGSGGGAHTTDNAMTEAGCDSSDKIHATGLRSRYIVCIEKGKS